MKINAWYGQCGALCVDREIKGVTWPENNEDNTRFYGSKWCIAESMTKEAARQISQGLGFNFLEEAP